MARFRIATGPSEGHEWRILNESAVGNGRRARFEHEAPAVAALNHPNILSIYEVCSEDGESLRQRIQRGRGGAPLTPLPERSGSRNVGIIPSQCRMPESAVRRSPIGDGLPKRSYSINTVHFNWPS